MFTLVVSRPNSLRPDLYIEERDTWEELLVFLATTFFYCSEMCVNEKERKRSLPIYVNIYTDTLDELLV
jgi:hypothetical protein